MPYSSWILSPPSQCTDWPGLLILKVYILTNRHTINSLYPHKVYASPFSREASQWEQFSLERAVHSYHSLASFGVGVGRRERLNKMEVNIMLPAFIFSDFRRADLVVGMQVMEAEANKKDREEGETVTGDEAERSMRHWVVILFSSCFCCIVLL